MLVCYQIRVSERRRDTVEVGKSVVRYALQIIQQLEILGTIGGEEIEELSIIVVFIARENRSSYR